MTERKTQKKMPTRQLRLWLFEAGLAAKVNRHIRKTLDAIQAIRERTFLNALLSHCIQESIVYADTNTVVVQLPVMDDDGGPFMRHK